MALELGFVKVVFRRQTIAQKFPGGEVAFRNRYELDAYLEDEHLISIGFMSTRDAEALIENLQPYGIELENRADTDVCTIMDGAVFPVLCGWITLDKGGCWHKGHDRGTLMRLRNPTIYLLELNEAPRLIGFFDSWQDTMVGETQRALVTKGVVRLAIDIVEGTKAILIIHSFFNKVIGAADDSAILLELDAFLVSLGAVKKY
ncbi:MAG: hypothetical protein KIS92_16030 [Planctomycetota bacterium]|nr:hypothetical protein [Planctomycetota bacterium]